MGKGNVTTEKRIKTRVFVAVTVFAAAVMLAAFCCTVFLPARKRLQPLFEARAAVFAQDVLGGRYTEEKTELKEFAAEIGCPAPRAAITTRYNAVTAMEFKTTRDAKKCMKVIAKNAAVVEPIRKDNLVFYAAAEGLSGLLTGKVFAEGGSCFYDTGDSLTLVRYGGATQGGGKPVTAVAYRAFAGQDVTQVTLPDTVTSVAREAFFGCTSLKSVTVGTACLSVGQRAFAQCTALKTLSFPAVTDVGENCFENAYALQSVTFGKNPSRLGEGLFTGCRALKSISFSQTGAYAFEEENGVLFGQNGRQLVRYLADNRAAEYEIPATVETLAAGAFETCIYLTRVTHADGGVLAVIADNAFHNCIRLTAAPLTAQAVSIGKRAFFNCRRLTDAPLSADLREIGREAFHSCTNYTVPVLSPSVQVGENAFTGCKEIAA